MKKRQKQKLWKRFIEFVKLQIAGNVLFFGTMGGTYFFSKMVHIQEFHAFVVASLISNVAYYLLDRQWVFTVKTHQRKGYRDLIRFIVFTILNFFINIAIVHVCGKFGLNVYQAQVLGGLFFTVWSYVGLKFWVFAPSRHNAITLESPRKGRRYDHGPIRSSKQKAKRTP